MIVKYNEPFLIPTTTIRKLKEYSDFSKCHPHPVKNFRTEIDLLCKFSNPYKHFCHGKSKRLFRQQIFLYRKTAEYLQQKFYIFCSGLHRKSG